MRRIPILYLAPWVDIGGSDKGTIDWFRYLDRDRFRASLITTQPSANRRLAEITPYAEEVWDLPNLMAGNEFARFIVGFIVSRQVRVVHVMNSRLAFELLPDIVQLPMAPRVVVQLHVEEPDRSGYVRYVTTRYGNLVDGFSVSSQALSDALDAYEVPVAKRRLIRTGIDAARQFSPERARPIDGLDADACQILYPVRLTAQKDPLLMVEVAARLRARDLPFRIHVLGDGELAPDVNERIRQGALQQQVTVHQPRADIAQWYAACDLVLLTSRFEGAPYVVYEAMAMARPIVAPDLPGIRELVTPGAGLLVSPRADPDAYASAIARLSADSALRDAAGAIGRARACSKLSLELMATEHASLYEQLLAAAPPSAPADLPTGMPPPSPALRGRRPGAKPLVSVIVPCYDHGRYLTACLQSIAEQTYRPIETIVVDDGSTDPETIARLAEIDRDGTVTVLRHAANRGPSAARNTGVARARGRYVLPLDADNLLVPGAIAALVEQLGSAGEEIGFVYPSYEFFGNRTDWFEAPSYNLHALLSSNYCDTSSLIDREVFDRGFRYPEDIGLGHEDWDFVLSLAEHRIYGEPARARTLMYRKHGFTRSDLVESASVPFASVIASRHPRLFAGGARLKAHWSPAVSVIGLDPLGPGTGDALGNLERCAARQSCQDFELILRSTADLPPTDLDARLRRLPSALATSRAQALANGISIARGRYAVAMYGSPAARLADRGHIEKTLRALRSNPSLDALAFVQTGAELPPFHLLGASEVSAGTLVAVCWPTTGSGAPPATLELSGNRPLEALARWLSMSATVQWRSTSGSDRTRLAATEGRPPVTIGAPRHDRERDARIRAECPPELPEIPRGVAERIRSGPVWTPPQARVLCRHLHHRSGRYMFTNRAAPPPGCSLHYHLGCVRALPLAGTRSLLVGAEPDRAFALGEDADLDALELLGFVEQAPLPLFDAIGIGQHRRTGQRVLIAGPDDPLAPVIDDVDWIGYIESYPIHPRNPPHAEVPYGLAGLVRTVDLGARRHRYAAGRMPQGTLAGELGALLTEPTGDCEPLWIGEDGRLLAAAGTRVNGRPPLGSALRWTSAPLTWRGLGRPGPRMRATARRAYDSALIIVSRRDQPAPRPRDPAGYLLRSATPRTLPLYAAAHPVTGDQLLSTDASEPGSLGYEHAILLGHLAAQAPVTGRLGIVRPGVPWASRFGLAMPSG